MHPIKIMVIPLIARWTHEKHSCFVLLKKLVLVTLPTSLVHGVSKLEKLVFREKCSSKKPQQMLIPENIFEIS